MAETIAFVACLVAAVLYSRLSLVTRCYREIVREKDKQIAELKEGMRHDENV